MNDSNVPPSVLETDALPDELMTCEQLYHIGALGRTRTANLPLRRRLLSPVELQAHGLLGLAARLEHVPAEATPSAYRIVPRPVRDGPLTPLEYTHPASAPRARDLLRRELYVHATTITAVMTEITYARILDRAKKLTVTATAIAANAALSLIGRAPSNQVRHSGACRTSLRRTCPMRSPR